MLLETERLYIASVNEAGVENNIFERKVIDQRCSKENVTYERLFCSGGNIGVIFLESNGYISYEIYEGYRGNGYATEALTACTDFALQNGVLPFLAINVENKASERVAKKAGYRKEFGIGKMGSMWFLAKK